MDKLSTHNMARKSPTIISSNQPNSSILNREVTLFSKRRKSKITNIFDIKTTVQHKERQHEKSTNSYGNNQNQHGHVNLLSKEREHTDSVPYRKHGSVHKWKDFPENCHKKSPC
jgi:hypothetical protein